MTNFRRVAQGTTVPSHPGTGAHAARKQLRSELELRGRDSAIKLGSEMRASLSLKRRVYRGDR